MRHLLLISVFINALLSTSAFSEDTIYRKPNSIKDWGEILVEYLGHIGYGKSYALVIGISQYEKFDDLPTRNDPIKIKEFLIHEAGFDYVHLLTEGDVTRQKIDDLMVDEFPSVIDTNDRFLFYWSGHGVTRGVGEGARGYLPLKKSPPKRYGRMVSMQDIKRWDGLIEAQQALYLLDSCFSGLAGVTKKSDIRLTTIERLTQPSRHLLTAGTDGEQTIALDSLGGSIFTSALLDGLRGDADAANAFPRDGVVSLRELQGYISARVDQERRDANWSRAITPQLRDLGTSVGEFFFLTSQGKEKTLISRGSITDGNFRYGDPSVVPMNSKTASVPNVEQRENKTKAKGIILEAQHVKLSRKERVEVQVRLKVLGYYSEHLDGVLGPNTRKAIKDWQISQRYTPSGYLTTNQLETLFKTTQILYDKWLKNEAKAVADKTRRDRATGNTATINRNDRTWSGVGRYVDEKGCLREANGDIVPGFKKGC